MKKAEKKVRVAQDVLNQLRRKRFVAEAGTYFASGNYYESEIFTEEFKLSINQVVTPKVLKEIKQCDVCARGALFVAQVERFNGKKFAEDFIFDNTPVGSQTEIFSAKELLDIENIFECGLNGEAFKKEDLTERLVGQLKPSFITPDYVIGDWTSAEERMKAIMRSIIRNKGKVDIADMKKAIVRIASANLKEEQENKVFKK